MEKNSLLNSIAGKLGISSSKKEFAFGIFLKKLSDSLNTDEALNVSGVGYFQLKDEPLLKGERKTSRGAKKLTKRTIFFSPENSTDKNDHSLFLSFDIDVEREDFTEFNENVFSLGVEKPIAPIFDDDDNLTDLQKSLESRIDDVIHTSEKLSDFDLFENFISKESESTGDDLPKETVSGQFDEPEIRGIPDDFLSQLPEEDADIPQTNTEADDKYDEADYAIEDSAHEEVIVNEESSDEQETEETEKNPFDELDEINFTDGEKEPEDDSEKSSESEKKEIIEDSSDQDDAAELTEKPVEEEKQTNKQSLPSFEEIFENDDDLLDSVMPVPEDQNKEEIIETEDEESIEWDWGDELKAEFHEVEDEESEKPEDVNPDHGSDEEIIKDQNGSIEDNLEDELDELNFDEDSTEERLSEDTEDTEDAEPEAINKSIDNDFEDEESEQPLEAEKSADNNEKKLPSFRNYDWKNQSYGKGFWILLGVFVLFTVFGLYYLLFWGGDKPQISDIKDMPSDSLNSDGLTPQNEISEIDSSELIKTEPIQVDAVENFETKDDMPKTLYRTIANEKRINSRIYSDGNKYMIQISSFKSKNRAENDATTYQSKGFDAFIVEAYLPQLGGTWYRVRIGYYNSVQDAEEAIKKNNL